MKTLYKAISTAFVLAILTSACAVLPGINISLGDSDSTPQAPLTLGMSSATPARALPTAQPTPTQLPPRPNQPAATAIPVVNPQPVPTQSLPQPTTPPLTDLNAFMGKLAAVIEMRDFDLIRAYMRDHFAIATWNSSLNVIDSDEAIQMLASDRLAPGSQPAARFGTDLVQLLNGADPLALWGPVDQVVRGFHVMGLGAQAADEAVMVIGRDPATGFLYFHGILIPPGGYFTFQAPDVVTGTSVQAVVALDYLNVRSGPGFNFAVEGALREGEIATVTGISLDGDWWQIRCVQDASGFCWVTTDPTLTQPIARP